MGRLGQDQLLGFCVKEKALLGEASNPEKPVGKARLRTRAASSWMSVCCKGQGILPGYSCRLAQHLWPVSFTKEGFSPTPTLSSCLTTKEQDTQHLISLLSGYALCFQSWSWGGISEITGIFALGTNVSSQRHILPRRHTNMQRFDRVKAFPFSVCLLGTR